MCMIIDANQWGNFLKKKSDMKPIHKWIDSRRGRIVASDSHPKLKKEMLLSIKRWETQKKRAHKSLKRVKWLSAEEEEKVIKTVKDLERQKIKSDDHHILALGRVSRVNLLCTEDKPLEEDWGKLISKGKIYKRAEHAHLLDNAGCVKR